MTDLRQRIADDLARARRRSESLTVDVLDDAELSAQHSPLMSPLVWDLAHIGNQEELWLVRDVGGREPVRADIDELYDAFKHPRSDRPALPLLDPRQSAAYIRRGPAEGARRARRACRWRAAGSPTAASSSA